MSTADPPVSAAGVGLGYGIAIAVSILILISTIMLASYACIRVKGGSNGGGSHSADDNADDDIYRSNHSFSFGAGGLSEQVVVIGLDEPAIKSYPKIVIGESRRIPGPNNGPCSICLSEYQAKDTVRCIPYCHHCFHADCVDGWLRMSATCPLCRNSPVPSAGSTPITTPLSELVPLSFNAR